MDQELTSNSYQNENGLTCKDYSYTVEKETPSDESTEYHSDGSLEWAVVLGGEIDALPEEGFLISLCAVSLEDLDAASSHTECGGNLCGVAYHSIFIALLTAFRSHLRR